MARATPPTVLLPSSNVSLELSPIVFEPLALPADAPAQPLTAASTSLGSLGSVASLDATTTTPSTISPWADGWLVTGRIVPAGGLITSSIELTDLAGLPASAERTAAPVPPGTRTSGATSATTPAKGGRSPVAVTRAPGIGFGSPIGRFAIDRSGVLLGGADDATASVRLVVPTALVGLAALVGILALLGQRRIDRRRRRLID